MSYSYVAGVCGRGKTIGEMCVRCMYFVTRGKRAYGVQMRCGIDIIFRVSI